MKISNILVCINNYNFSDNADNLKDIFKSRFDTIIIDSSSDKKPKQLDVSIENKFYPGLWNESVKLAIEKYEWLFFIASDIKFIFPDTHKICDIVNNIINQQSVGVYSPSVSSDSRCSFKGCYNKNTNSLRKVKSVEGFIFLARTEILKIMYPIDIMNNKYGWGLDIAMCNVSKKLNFDIIIDDNMCVFHPKSNYIINKKLAMEESKRYIDMINQKL